MKYLPQLAFYAAVVLLLAKSFSYGPTSARDPSRMGLSVAMQSGHLHFRAEFGSRFLALHL